MKVILLSSIVLSVLFMLLESTLADQNCPAGQVLDRCKGLCKPACRDEDRVCSGCLPGCVCANNNVFDFTGQCIPRSQCCPRGQVESQCQGGCAPSCRDEDRACTAQCVRGCVCANNYVFDFTGRCIPRRACCPRGWVETECRANCPPTCADPNGTRPCAGHCVRGCICAPGTVLAPNGRCVRLDQCPASCPRGQVPTECNAKCPPTCKDPYGQRPCTKECVKGCICARGTVFTRDGRCVPINQCPGNG